MIRPGIAAFGVSCLLISLEPALAQNSSQQQTEYLQQAIEIANWLDSVAVRDEHGTRWPIAPGDNQAVSASLYSGTSGIVLFYLELYRVTDNQEYLQAAKSGGDWLITQTKLLDIDSDVGFYSGLTGIGYTLDQLHRVTKEDRFLKAADAVFAKVMISAKSFLAGNVHHNWWNDMTDVIAGSAGIGFYLIDRLKHHSDSSGYTNAMVVAAGDHLLSIAEPVDQAEKNVGLRWKMSTKDSREMPNYSHGTAGVCDFLLALDAYKRRLHAEKGHLYDGKYGIAAREGAAYLESLAYKKENADRIPHHLPASGELFYFGWCHGPVGTVGFLQRLAESETEEKKKQRWQALSDRLVRAMLATGIPENRPDGFWNNCGLCCGNAGAASFLYDYSLITGNASAKNLSQKLTDDLMKRATKVELENGKNGLKWIHAEHRARPDLTKAQTGLMQGASGIGIWLIKLHRQETKQGRLKIQLPLFSI